MASDSGPVLAPLDPDTLHAIERLVMLAKDAGCSEFTCAHFTVRFPPPAPTIVERVVPVVPQRERGVVGEPEAPKDNLSLLFPHGRPALFNKAGE